METYEAMKKIRITINSRNIDYEAKRKEKCVIFETTRKQN